MSSWCGILCRWDRWSRWRYNMGLWKILCFCWNLLNWFLVRYWLVHCSLWNCIWSWKWRPLESSWTRFIIRWYWCLLRYLLLHWWVNLWMNLRSWLYRWWRLSYIHSLRMLWLLRNIFLKLSIPHPSSFFLVKLLYWILWYCFWFFCCDLARSW